MQNLIINPFTIVHFNDVVLLANRSDNWVI